jgi:ubiquinol-cytochrome c reductase iron-sulfur subunit
MTSPDRAENEWEQRPDPLEGLAEPPDDPWAARAVGAAFLLTGLGGVALAAAFALGLPTPVQGILVFLALGSLGFGIVLWAHRLLPRQEYVEMRHPLSSRPDAARLVTDTLVAERGLSRRSILRWLLLGGLGGVGAAFVVPLFSLGPAPDERVFTTAWRRGLRLVDENGQPVTAAAAPLDSVRTVFPEGSAGSAQAQTLLIHTQPSELRLAPDRAAGAPGGFVAYSKLCTHAGCPVGIYQATTRSLVCPCHQSTFLVNEGARPVFGPAARPLPQLPIQLQPDGTFVALGDFFEPVGPSIWNMPLGAVREQA